MDESKKKNEKVQKEETTIRFDVLEWLHSIVFALTVGILLFLAVFHVVEVNGSSMFDTLYNGDKILCCNLFYKPKQGDVIVFRPARNDLFEGSLIKRVIADEGQTVDIDFETGVVTVDGEVLDEPYIYELTHKQEDFSGPVVVPAGTCFVMGDNRNGSTDSRSNLVGFIDKREIIGKAMIVFLPASLEGRGLDFSRFGSVH